MFAFLSLKMMAQWSENVLRKLIALSPPGLPYRKIQRNEEDYIFKKYTNLKYKALLFLDVQTPQSNDILQIYI